MEDLSNKNIKIDLKTFKNMKNHVVKYLAQGGNISEDRHIPLQYPSENSDYITYSAFKDMLTRYEAFLEKNHREPSYILIKVSSNQTTGIAPAGKRFSTTNMNLAAQQIQSSIASNRGLPESIELTATDGKTYTLKQPQYAGLFESRNLYIRTHGKYPTFVTYNTDANNPVIAFYQSNMYNCCPRSLANAIMTLYGECGGINLETKCVKALETNKNGTNPNNIPSGAKKLGYTATKISRNLSAVKASLDLGKPVIAHIQTGGNTKPTCLKYKNNYGHYILIYSYKDNNYKVLDPTKGLKTCSSSSIDKATNGRVINYYSIGS